MPLGHGRQQAPRRRGGIRNHLRQETLIGSKWTALTPVLHSRRVVVTGWANSPTDCDGAPDSVVIKAVDTGRCRVVAWRRLRDGTHWCRGWS